jgi:hypothetical protein
MATAFANRLNPMILYLAVSADSVCSAVSLAVPTYLYICLTRTRPSPLRCHAEVDAVRRRELATGACAERVVERNTFGDGELARMELEPQVG